MSPRTIASSPFVSPPTPKMPWMIAACASTITPSSGSDLRDDALHVRADLDRDRRLAQDELSAHLRDALERPVARRGRRVASPGRTGSWPAAIDLALPDSRADRRSAPPATRAGSSPSCDARFTVCTLPGSSVRATTVPASTASPFATSTSALERQPALAAHDRVLGDAQSGRVGVRHHTSRG